MLMRVVERLSTKQILAAMATPLLFTGGNSLNRTRSGPEFKYTRDEFKWPTARIHKPKNALGTKTKTHFSTPGKEHAVPGSILDEVLHFLLASVYRSS